MPFFIHIFVSSYEVIGKVLLAFFMLRLYCILNLTRLRRGLRCAQGRDSATARPPKDRDVAGRDPAVQ